MEPDTTAPSQQNEGSIDDTPGDPQRSRGLWKKWGSRTFALVAWVWVYEWNFGRLPLPPAAEKLNDAIDTIGLPIALCLIGIVLFVAAVRGPIGFLQFALYTLFFPLIFPVLVLRFILAIFWPPLRMIGTAVGALSRSRRWLWFSALLVAAIPYLCVLIAGASRPWIIRLALFALFTCTTALIAAMFAWALAPVRIILGIGDRAIRWVLRRLGDVYFQHIPKAGPITPKIQGQIDSSVTFASSTRHYLESFAAFLLRPATAVLAFLMAFMGLFVVVVVSFGFQYLAIWRLDPEAFAGGPSSPNAWEMVFFSITTMATLGTSPLRAVNVVSQALVAAELLYGLAVVSLLALSFSTLHSADLEAARALWKETEEHIRSKFALWELTLEFIQSLFTGGFGELAQESFAQAEGASADEKWLSVVRGAGEGLMKARPAIETMFAEAMNSLEQGETTSTVGTNSASSDS